MIIDAHAHILTSKNDAIENGEDAFNVLQEIVANNKIDYVVVSNIDAIETKTTDSGYEYVMDGKTQVELTKRMIELLKDKPNYRILPWCKPHTEGFSAEFAKLLLDNMKNISGLKFHPFHSKLKITDKKVKPYIEFAEKYNLPILVHCAIDKYSRAKYTYKIAKKYPNVKFIMAHLELFSSNFKKTEKRLLKLENLYADSAWLPADEVINLIRIGGEDKIIFGTDAPIGGKDHYEKYSIFFDEKFIGSISNSAYEKLMYKNARKVYRI